MTPSACSARFVTPRESNDDDIGVSRPEISLGTYLACVFLILHLLKKCFDTSYDIVAPLAVL